MTAPAEPTTCPGPAAPSALANQPQYYWLWVLCLLGVDYFSSLAYQPSITFEVAGYLGPIATVVVVLVTLLGALPVYAHVAGKSPHGQGSIALMERMVHGWGGKTLVLLLLGFAATLGGDVRVRSEPGAGSTFTLELPATGGSEVPEELALPAGVLWRHLGRTRTTVRLVVRVRSCRNYLG